MVMDHPLLLIKAAKDGNTVELLHLLQSDPLILEKLSVMGTADTSPLHIAAMLGHVGFVRELINHKKNNVVSYVKELDQHGFSPMHLASANGHTEVVKELLKVSPQELCKLKGRDGIIPLHCAAIKGRVEAIVELLKASPAAVMEVTVGGETCVHLAVRHNQLEALRMLVKWLKLNNMFLGVLGLKDGEGNTALHLAASRRLHLATEVLLKCNAENGGKMLQINARNKNNQTALDLALISCSCSCSCSEIERLLMQAGAGKPSWVSNQNQQIHQFQAHKLTPQNVLLVVVTLITIATYQAMLSPPGGIEENGPQFVWFVLCNSTGFFISIATIWAMVQKSPWSLAIYTATFALVCSYQCAVYRASPPGKFRNVAIFICVALPFVPFIALQFKNFWLSRRRQSSSGMA